MKKILLIRKDLKDAESMADILRLSGYEVAISSATNRVIEEINGAQPDLIICDIELETSVDCGLLDKVKKNKSAQDVPFVFMGPGEALDEARLGMNLGADDFLIVPVDSVDLLNTVATRLSKSKFIKNKKSPPHTTLNGAIRGWEALAEMSVGQEIRNYGRKELIFSAGDRVRYLYVVKKGRVKVFKSNRLRKELVTDLYLPGEFFGAEALVFDMPNCTNAMAIEKTELLLIPREIFLDALEQNPNFASLIINQFAQTIEQKEKRMLSMAYDSVRKRIADILISLSEQKNLSDEGVKVLREDISNMVGTAKESVSRILSEFKDEDLIEISSGRINILRRDRLASISA